MGRKSRSIRGETLTSKILDIAFRHKAQQIGSESYSIAQLERDLGLHHSVIARAAQYNSKKRIGY